MHDTVVTLFNFHEKTDAWYTTVFGGVHLMESKAETVTRDSGKTNEDTVEIILRTLGDKTVRAISTDGRPTCVRYIGEKAYNALENPHGYFTFKAETDFIAVGNHAQTAPIIDDEYDEGLYHAMNTENDDVYMITSVSYFSLIPHFEIGGK